MKEEDEGGKSVCRRGKIRRQHRRVSTVFKKKHSKKTKKEGERRRGKREGGTWRDAKERKERT